jgi:site-specific DNA recombinase
MAGKAEKGLTMNRPPLGYSIKEKNLILNEESSKVHSIFTVFLKKNYSLNSMAKHYGLSVNGLKKILTNRTYLGEIKFNKQIFKGNHKPLVSPEIFYAVQRKLKEDVLRKPG